MPSLVLKKDAKHPVPLGRRQECSPDTAMAKRVSDHDNAPNVLKVTSRDSLMALSENSRNN